LDLAPAAGWAQEAPTESAPTESAPSLPAPVDPNIELRAKLDELRSSNDAFAAKIELLKQLLTLNVCDPQTRAKIEELIAAARQASADGGETLTDTADGVAGASTPVSLDTPAQALTGPLSLTDIPTIAHSADISTGSSSGAAGKFAISAAIARAFLGRDGVSVPVGTPCAGGAN
jgi:hypothetical protein